MLVWNTNNPGKSTFATPYDSAHGMPTWAYIVAIGVILFIVFKVWIALKREGAFRNKKKKKEKQPTS